MRKLVAVALTILSSVISSEVLAQSRVDSDRFINVSEDPVMLLDRNSITGNRFQLVMSKDNNNEYQVGQYQVVCSRKVYVMLSVNEYDSDGRLVRVVRNPSGSLRNYNADSPIGRAAAIVCQNK